MKGKHYLKDVMPRLYAELEEWLKQREPKALYQLPHLHIVGRCDCGDCCDFYIDSDLPELSKEQGSTKLKYPCFYRSDTVFYVGLTWEKLSDGTEIAYVAGFDFSGLDYPDGYVNQQLESIGLLKASPEPNDE